jgi:hypothetical protein
MDISQGRAVLSVAIVPLLIKQKGLSLMFVQSWYRK